MDEIHAHKHVIKGRGVTTYKKEVTPETAMGETYNEVLDIKLVKLVFVAMAAVVAFGISMLLFPI